MRIGIDFDNTIACYDGVFHAAALGQGLIPANLAFDKNSVRDFLNGTGRQNAFTELQGYVYGARMDLAVPYLGAVTFITEARKAGHEIFIISHKTRYPLLGEQYDLHEAARGFLAAHAIGGPGGLIPDGHICFELTKEAKQARAIALRVEVFVDDLPEILSLAGWPGSVRRVLFDPGGLYPDGAWQGQTFERYANWAELHCTLLAG